MVDIIRYLDENGVKTRHGNSYHKDTIRRILTNRKYLGIYIYDNVEVVGGIPRIIDDSTFNDAQEMLERNKKAPARKKAVKDNYLLTTKLFCGHCLSALVGWLVIAVTLATVQFISIIDALLASEKALVT